MLLGPGPLTFKMAAMPFEGPIDHHLVLMINIDSTGICSSTGLYRDSECSFIKLSCH